MKKRYKFWIIIFLAFNLSIITASIVERYSNKEIIELEKEKLELQIELYKRNLYKSNSL